ncbi:MAG: tetratricopeptide repeat protein [Acidobacteria bacterium]|nr:tetratricopeptide repeat protein [Acidobacteriota bacterium]
MIETVLVLAGLLAAVPATGMAAEAALDRLRACLERSDAKCVAVAIPAIESGKSWDCAECQETLARAFLLLRRKTEAFGAIARAVELDGGKYGYLMTQGLIHQRFDDHVEAIRSFLLADRIEPRNPGTFYSLGMSFFLLKEYERAGRHFKHAVEIDPRFDKAEFMLGIVEAFSSRTAEAKTHLQRALSLQPGNAFYHLHYGIVLSRLSGDLAGGVRELETAANLNPDYAFARFNLGRAYLQAGRVADAKQELEAAVRLRPDLARAWYQLAAVYRRLGNADEAGKALARFELLRKEEKDAEQDDADAPFIPGPAR